MYHVNDNICDDEVYEPVCGSNGATFPNECYAKNSGITIYTAGECEWEDSNSDIFCWQ